MHLSREGKPDITVAGVIEVAKAAGRAIMTVYSEDPETWDSRSKSDDTPVTKADVIADELISKGLQKAYPDIPIISEESEHLPFDERRGFDYCWIVDPLDGTKEFIRRTGDFAVMIGLSLSGSPVLGVVHAPAQEVPKTYYAVAGKGAFVLEGAEDGKDLEGSRRISASSFSLGDPGLRLAVSTTRPPEAFIATCDNPETLFIGSAGLKAIAVAEGKADVYPCFTNTCEWDTCATQVILEESGGMMVPCDGMEDHGLRAIAGLKRTPADGSEEGSELGHGAGRDAGLSYNKKNLSSPSFMCLGRWRS